MHITEFLKNNNHLRVDINLDELNTLLVTTTSGEFMVQEKIHVAELIPGKVEMVWFRHLDKIVAKQNEMAATGNS